MKNWLSALALVAAVWGAPIEARAQSTPAVTLSSWPMANFDYANTRTATGTPISSANVGQLAVAWTFDVDGVSDYGALASTPVVVNGVVYLQDLQSNVYAIDLTSGSLKWQKQYNSQSVGPNGPAVDSNKVIVESSEQTVAALDAATGQELWSTQIAPPVTQGIDQQIAIFNGTVYVSTVPGPSAPEFYPPGGLGIIYALDEQSGAVKWSFNTVKDGDLWGNPDVNSGGGAWYAPAIDTSTGTTYWGIGNPAPFPGTADFPNGSSRPGPNPYTDSVIALDKSGELQWAQQVKAHDLSDGDFQAPPILASLNVNGASHDIVIGGGKLGSVVAFDRQTGEQLWKTDVGMHQNDTLDAFPADSPVTVLPGVFGGIETPMAYADGVVYAPVTNLSSDYTATSGPTGTDLSTATGELDAIDAASGRVLWTATLDSANFGAATVAGDLVFTSTYSGEVLAFDRASGSQVWSWQAPAAINAFLSVAGDMLLVPVGQGDAPQLVALRLGTPTQVAPANALLSISSPVSPPLSFDTTTLTVAAGAHVTLSYTNDSPIAHNWDLFDGPDAGSPSVASTPIISGPGATQTVEFTAPTQSGSYFFRCDVHPTIMSGHLVVVQAAP
jgi:outer membrane protein assembly factor BamB/plastocyanin